jgi:hypothetical protein
MIHIHALLAKYMWLNVGNQNMAFNSFQNSSKNWVCKLREEIKYILYSRNIKAQQKEQDLLII